jgi:SAM-dependent MidA family methyltransferase
VLREVFVAVGTDGALADLEADPSTPELAARLAAESIDLHDGQPAEVCLAVDRWVARAAAGLARGVLLVIDYGHPATELYDPRRRPAGTLATYLGHRVGDDPYRSIGRQDLTAHVDVTAVERAATAAGLDHIGTVTQAEFLSRLGAGELLVAEQSGPGTSLQAYLETRSALVRMIDPGAMGRFRVMAFGRGLAPGTTLPGLD